MKMLGIAKKLLGSRWVKWSVMVIAVVVGGYEIYSKWQGVSSALHTIGLLAAFEALLALLVAQFGNLKVWQVLLAGLGSPLSTRVAARILLVGQLGKYIPGSLWPILTQMQLGAQAKVPRDRSASTSVLAMLVSLAVGLFVAVVTLPFTQHSDGYLAMFLLLPVFVVGFYPKVLNRLLNKLFKLAKRTPLETPVSDRVVLEALAWQLMVWVFQGLQIWILAERFHAPAGKTALIALGGWAFAWCAGFVAVLAPAGAGIRDVLLFAALKPVIGGPPATAVVLVSRGINIINDLLVAGVAAFRRPRATAPDTAANLPAPVTVPPEEPAS
jgi:hypothetical protein